MLTLKQLAEQIGAKYIGDDQPVSGTAFDSRMVNKGDLFVAIKGNVHDGHDFIDRVVQAGAVVVLVDHKVKTTAAQIVVDDTVRAFGDMAALWRQQFNLPLIGITGSCGKTSTKEMLASILQEVGPTLATEKSYNSQISVPHMLFKLRPEHRFAVIEMGTSQRGEMSRLAEIAKPTVSMITNISLQHAKGLGSETDIAEEKSAIYAVLSQSGIAIINNDVEFASAWRQLIDTRHCVTFGVEQAADVTATQCHFNVDSVTFDIVTPIGQQAIGIPLPGEHVVSNALAAIAASMAVGTSLKQVAQGLAKVTPHPQRFESQHLTNGALLVDDTFNASPASVKAALKSLKRFDGKRIFVMTNMGELGDQCARIHGELGDWMSDAKLSHVFLFGDEKLLAPTLAQCEKAVYYKDKAQLVEALVPLLDDHTMVVIKGSRANTMETVVTDVINQVEKR